METTLYNTSFTSVNVGVQFNGRFSPSYYNHYLPFCPFNSCLKPNRLRISYKKGIVPTHVTREPIKCCLGGNYSEASLDLGNSDTTDNSNTEATVDLKLPRRSLLVTFTCNSCGDRTKRLINRLAYERGTVFVQCAGCLKHHKLVDNLGLVVEYDFREIVE